MASDPKNCAENRKPGGCQLHNLHCRAPECFKAPRAERPADATPRCPICLNTIYEALPDTTTCGKWECRKALQPPHPPREAPTPAMTDERLAELRIRARGGYLSRKEADELFAEITRLRASGSGTTPDALSLLRSSAETHDSAYAWRMYAEALAGTAGAPTDLGKTENDQPQEPEPSRDASSPLSEQDLAWMDGWAARCRTPYADMTPDEARKVTAFAAMWFVPALNEVHRLRAAIRYYADQRKRYPRSGAEIHAFGKLLATVEPPERASVLAVDPSRSIPDALTPPTP
jgi:hypothetical protein